MRNARSLFIVVLFFLVTFIGKSQSGPWSFINTGIKLAYVIGEKGGLNVGLEVSYSVWSHYDEDLIVYGIAVAVDDWDDLLKIRFGLQGQWLIVGGIIGPAFLLQDTTWSVGLALSMFTGALIYPYFETTIRFDDQDDIHEVGSYFKLPLQISGKKSFN